jgi:hypothetical protein
MVTNPCQRSERAVGRQHGRVLKRIAVGAAAAVLCVIAGAGAAQAQAAALSPGRAVGVAASGPARLGVPAGVHVLKASLHNRYLADLRRVRLGKTAGILRPRGGSHAAAAKGTDGCTEPACDVSYGGGPVQHNPHVFVVLWGPNWTTDPAQAATLGVLIHLYVGLGGQPQDTWSPVTAQYGDATGFPAFTGPVITAAAQDTSTPPTGVTTQQLGAEAAAWAAQFQSEGYPIGTDSQIVVATQSGTCPQNFGSPSCPAPAPNSAYCAWHSAFSEGSFSNVPFINLPYILDAGSFCYQNAVNPGSAGTYDGVTIAAGHEYAETVTDPVPLTGWHDPSDGVSGGEIADKCITAYTPGANVTLSNGTYALQKLWSNAAGGCVIAATEDTVTVNGPGTQTTGTGGTASLQLTGASSDGDPLQWSATGLPAGLSISPAGLITGTATTTGTYTPVVSANDDTGAIGSASFTWNVVADTVTVTSPGNQTSYAQAAASLPLSGSSSGGFSPLTWGGTFPAGATINSTGPTTGVIGGAPYNPGTLTATITATDTAGVTGSTSFTWTIKPDAGKQLKETSAKMCLNDKNSVATAGNAVNVWKCQPLGSILGLGAQDWSYSAATGQLKVFGLCLADPKSGGTGTKLTLATCQSATPQHWTHQSNGEYVLKLNGLCLTDPNDSTTNGTQVTITKCTAATSQQWALP